ncbi:MULTISPECIES: DUF6182 family protein [unclassified Micromonospora]|uniref:DUF6182 family protein n=1 Tax=unclassified Micromonospora TaxID=2617518 RepID=UPI0022C9899A|nr:DUF6182 family protein [Micromonospora sp. AKA38]GHJ17467.1 hypothetical protein TPA0908_54620 [Micromonospora sp. AKA38]
MSAPVDLDGAPSESRLAELLAARAAWVGAEPHRAADDTGGCTVLVLLRSVDLDDLVRGARCFAAGLSDGEADAWRRSWTRTRFLFGNSANLTARNPARVVAPTGSAAWLGPFPAGRLPGLSRLLKPVTGVLPALPAELDLPPVAGPASAHPGAPRELHVAVRALTLAEYLVHLHHTLAESVLRGSLRADEPLRLIHRTDLDARLVRTEPGYARVHHARGDSPALRLFTWLSPEPRR